MATTETTEQKIKKGKRLTDDERAALNAKVIRMYQDKTSIRAIVEETGRSYGSIHRIVTDAQAAGKLTVRTRGGKTK
jgi:predicted transcriptional regulator